MTGSILDYQAAAVGFAVAFMLVIPVWMLWAFKKRGWF